MKRNQRREVKVIQDEEKPIAIEILAKAIKDTSDGFKKAMNSGLSRRAIIVLIQDAVGAQLISKTDVANVLDGLDSLERNYCTKK